VTSRASGSLTPGREIEEGHVGELALERLTFTEPVLIIRVARRWHEGIGSLALYEATRRCWKLNPERAADATCIVAVAKGIVRAVYVATEWRPCQRQQGKDRGRWEFVGREASEKGDWIGRDVAYLFEPGDANPIRYVNG
jgi:hypothetical protein